MSPFTNREIEVRAKQGLDKSLVCGRTEPRGQVSHCASRGHQGFLGVVLEGCPAHPLVEKSLSFAGSLCSAASFSMLCPQSLCTHSSPGLQAVPTPHPKLPSGPGSAFVKQPHFHAPSLSPSQPWPRWGAVAPPQSCLGGWESPAQSWGLTALFFVFSACL